MSLDSKLFNCTQCGQCCRGYGGTYVTEEDIRAIASYLGVTATVFKERYCVFSGTKPLLVQGENGFCVFWDKNCSIHPVKPKMCRAWPYIDNLLIDIANWYAMAGSCPGMRTDMEGRQLLKSIREILAARG